MVRLNLLLADHDTEYLKRLADYIQIKQSTILKVDYVTDEANLKRYMERYRDEMDMMLVAPSMARGLYPGARTTVVLMSDGRLETADGDYPVIEKYQRGDALVSQVLKIYLEQHPERRFINTAQASGKLVGVFSPSGGCGKSSIAAGLSIIAHQKGSQAMYLNMEGCESTESFFPYPSGSGISELYYHLKDGASQLSIKLEALSYRDPATRVRSFAPAESLLDYNELTDGELDLFSEELRRIPEVDVVFVDLAPSVESRNLKLLELMDSILLVVSDDISSQTKVRHFMKQLPMLERKLNVDITSRTVLVRNSRGGNSIAECGLERMQGSCFLDRDRSLSSGRTMADRMGGPFGNGLQSVWNALGIGTVNHGI